MKATAQPISHSELFLRFLKLGCIAFGGPVAHIGFFREHFVQRHKWLSESAFGDLVALCQFLPGPASSQVGFAIGYLRGGIVGAFLAWLGFTLPSAILMLAMGLGLATLGGLPTTGVLTGLKLAAVAVVAHAIWGMAGALCSDRPRALLALFSASGVLLMGGAAAPVLAIGTGAVLGWVLLRQTAKHSETPRPSASIASQTPKGWPFLMAFAALLLGLPLLRSAHPDGLVAVIEAFYRAGSLVFGGGHVVLPLLDAFTVATGWIDTSTFMAGYGMAQALPGPLFAYSAFLGATITPGPGGLPGGLLALVAIYLPSWLLMLGTLPYWNRLRRVASLKAALMGANAAVVGLLVAAFYDPVWSSAVVDARHLAFAMIAFALLRFGRVPPALLVLGCALAGAICLPGLQ